MELFIACFVLFFTSGCAMKGEKDEPKVCLVESNGRNVIVRDDTVYHVGNEIDFNMKLEEGELVDVYFIKKTSGSHNENAKVFHLSN